MDPIPKRLVASDHVGPIVNLDVGDDERGIVDGGCAMVDKEFWVFVVLSC
jgi:hypothetical protein